MQKDTTQSTSLLPSSWLKISLLETCISSTGLLLVHFHEGFSLEQMLRVSLWLFLGSFPACKFCTELNNGGVHMFLFHFINLCLLFAGWRSQTISHSSYFLTHGNVASHAISSTACRDTQHLRAISWFRLIYGINSHLCQQLGHRYLHLHNHGSEYVQLCRSWDTPISVTWSNVVDWKFGEWKSKLLQIC